MNLILLAIAVFLAVAILILSIFVIFLTPNRDKALRNRLRAIQYAEEDISSSDGETKLLRQKILSQSPVLDRLLVRVPIALKLNMFIQQAGLEIHVARLLAIMLIIYVTIFLIGLILQYPLIAVLVVAAVGAIVPYLIIGVKRQQRFSRFEEQFPESIDLLARAVRAGHAFTTGMELIGKEMPEPIATEFRTTYEQQNLGLPLREAFQNLLLRVPLDDVHVFVTALMIQRESGGNLAEILDSLAAVIRDRFKLMKQVRVFTAQGRITLYILTAVPPITLLMLYFMNPRYMEVLFKDPTGLKLLALAVILQILGFLTIRKTIQPKL